MPTTQQYFIYLAIFLTGAVIGRITMAFQYAKMKPESAAPATPKASSGKPLNKKWQ